jgi:hypothetical protein
LCLSTGFASACKKNKHANKNDFGVLKDNHDNDYQTASIVVQDHSNSYKQPDMPQYQQYQENTYAPPMN